MPTASPGQLAQLGSPQTMPIGDQDHGRIAMTVAVALRGLDQLLDLGLGQVLPLPVVGIRPTVPGQLLAFRRLAPAG